MKLLSPAATNAKTAKNASQGNYLSYTLHLAPAKMSGYNTCPAASAGCAAACLNTAGRGAFSNVQQARIRKTKLFFEARSEFLQQLQADLDAVVRKATKLGAQAVVRLNGTSDLDWIAIKLINGKNVFESYPTVQFYDYTKLLPRLKRLKLNPISNYNVTFSRSESNGADCLQALKLGFNVAAVFSGMLPTSYKGYTVLDGDTHDLRFLDLQGGHVVGLKAKGKAKKDTIKFVITAQLCKKGA